MGFRMSLIQSGLEIISVQGMQFLDSHSLPSSLYAIIKQIFIRISLKMIAEAIPYFFLPAMELAFPP